jgi:hypothetical protein
MSFTHMQFSSPSNVAAAIVYCLAILGPPAVDDATAQAAPQAKPAAQAAKPAAKANKATAPVSTLDNALLEDLDNELLDGVKDLPIKKRPGSGGKTPAGDKTSENPDDRTKQKNAGQKALDQEDGNSAAASESDDESEDMTSGDAAADEEPLARIGQQMRTVEKQLERQQAAGDTEQLQGQILNDLTALIKKLEQQCQSQCSSDSKPSKSQSQQASRDSVKQPKGGSGNPASQSSNKPAKESTDRQGKNDVQKPDLDAIKGLLKDAWGQLPPHAREQMLQSPPEQFLPKYELLIEKYYKRLAEEQKQKP